MQRSGLLALALLALAAPGFCDPATSSDGSFSVEAPAGWRQQAPKPGYLLSLSPTEGKGGFTLSPAPAEVTSDASAQAGLQALAAQLGPKLKTQFGKPQVLDTPQPGRLVFVLGSLGGKPYLLGYHGIGGRWLRVDLLADGAPDAANALLSSLRPAGAGDAGGTAPKRSKDRAYTNDGRFSVLLSKGWKGVPASGDSQLILATSGGDDIRIAFEPSVDDDAKASQTVDKMAAAVEKDQGLRFSNASREVVEDIDLHYSLGHAQGEMLDTALVGVFKAGGSYFRLAVVAKVNRPLDLAQTALEGFQLKGQEAAGSEGGAPAAKPEAPSGPPPDEIAKKFKSKSSGGSEGYHWVLIGGMALVPILLVGGIALFGRQKQAE